MLGSLPLYIGFKPVSCLLQIEQNVRPVYLQGQDVTGNMRAILIDWLVQVNLKFRLLQETMYMTVGIIDRFLQVGENLSLSDHFASPHEAQHCSLNPTLQTTCHSTF